MTQSNSIDRFIDAEKEPTKSLLPLEGYEKVPLTAQRNCEKPAYGFTAYELASIHLYMVGNSENPTSFYKVLNQKLRSENQDELKSWYHYLKLFLTALYKLPSLKTVAWRVIRGGSSHLKQKDFVWWSISSCAETLEVIEDFAGQEGARTIFMIECINRKSIKSYSHYPKEKEIILMPDTYLRVVSKGNLVNGLKMIHLHEDTAPVPLPTPPFNLSSLSKLSTYDVSLK